MSSTTTTNQEMSSQVPKKRSRATRPEGTSHGGDTHPETPSIKAGEKRKRDDDVKDNALSGPATANDEEPVLSHAALRKAKKKTTNVSLGKDNDPGVVLSKAEGEEDKIKRGARQNSVWVGNLAFKTSQDDLRTFFSSCGDITRINMPTKKGGGGGPHMRGQNMGFAYVDFSTTDGQAAAIQLSENPLHGRKLLIKSGSDFAGRPAATVAEGNSEAQQSIPGVSKTGQKILRSQKHPPGPTLFLGNLGFETTEESIRQMIEGHHKADTKLTAPILEKTEEAGYIALAETPSAAAPDAEQGLGLRKVRMGTFEDSGLCKGFAFLDFHTATQATAVLVNPRNHRLNGRDLVVEFAGADAIRRGGVRLKPMEDSGGAPHKEKRTPKTIPLEAKARRAVPPSGADSAGPAGERPAKRARLEPPKGVDEPTVRDGREKSKPRGRMKPGAALALAVETKAKTGAILQSEGKKIVFS